MPVSVDWRYLASTACTLAAIVVAGTFPPPAHATPIAGRNDFEYTVAGGGGGSPEGGDATDSRLLPDETRHRLGRPEPHPLRRPHPATGVTPEERPRSM